LGCQPRAGGGPAVGRNGARPEGPGCCKGPVRRAQEWQQCPAERRAAGVACEFEQCRHDVGAAGNPAGLDQVPGGERATLTERSELALEALLNRRHR